MLLLFSVQTFSYPVLLLRFHHHFDCAGQEKKDCHEKDAQSHCNGNCNLTQQLKDMQDNDTEPVKGGLVPCPEIPALVQPVTLEPIVQTLAVSYPEKRDPHCLPGSPIPFFHPPLN